MDYSDESCIEELKQFAEQAYSEELLSILCTENFHQHYSIMIDSMSLFESNVTFAHILFECPERALKVLDQAFHQAALSICKQHKLKSNMVVKGTIHVRLTSLPQIPEIYRTNLPLCSDVGQFMCISGTVIRKAGSRVVEFRKLWKCKKCKYQFTIDAEVEKGYIFEKPLVCPNPEWCNGKNFTLLSTDVDPMYCKDYCEVKIQQQFNTLTVGSVPRSIWIILEDDLVDTCYPGNDVNVSGVLIQRWKPLSRGCFIDIDLVLYAHNVEVKNKMIPGGIVTESLAQEYGQFWLDYQADPLKGRDFILSSICPQVFGLYIVKLAVALTLAGGVEKKDENSRIRGDSHLLLVGDPGTGKSQFLKFASKVCLRTVITSGVGTTNAGLTVSAVKESGKWQLEAGALVLADGGLCCIDEFSCIKEQDKTCIHEAMEQQTISVAKAGLVCSLSTKCSILAATNPKGKYDENLSLSENTALASPLLSRFDIILVLLDTYDENWDKMVSSYILEGHNFLVKSQKCSWSISKMKSYFNLIRYINPKVTSSCEKVLQAYYKRQRSLEDRNFARTTPRLLQSLIRLAEGHARLMFRDKVLVIDAIMAIILMESSMSGSAILDGLTTLHTSFPEDPKFQYTEKAKIVLKLLNLEDLLEDAENYEFSYQDMYVQKLFSEISVTSKSNKSNSYLFSSSSFSNPSCLPNISIDHLEENHVHFSSTPFEKVYLSNKISDKEIPRNSLNSLNNRSLKQHSEVYNSEQKQETIKTQRHNQNNEQNLINKPNKAGSFENEITTLSDLKNMFSDDLLSQTDTKNSFRNIFKRKHATENFAENHSNEPQTKYRNLFDKETSSEKALHTASSSERKVKDLTESTDLNLSKIFPLQTKQKVKDQPIDQRNLNLEIPNEASSTMNYFIKETEQNSFLLNNIDEYKTSARANENTKIKTDVAVAKSQTQISNNNVTDPKTILSLIEPKANKNHKTSSFQSNEVSTKSNHYKKQKEENPFKKFLFKKIPKKSETVNPNLNETSCTSASIENTDSCSQKSKITTNILSSQKTFKRIFSSSIKEDTVNLDDPFFSM
ncbi:DNA helicase MCM9 [Caerostris darwini]|uniref:DNA helicase MCM9 n=1 Tax=Caerostris darwini TaxID=1538125 RepID=A0AAV4S802_9ARAC|nr:DNA helicase MCM9 [Caerostris darwini]